MDMARAHAGGWRWHSVVRLRRLDVNTPEGLRKDARITLILSVLLLGLGALNLWDGDVFSGIGCFFGAAVSLWLVHRNYRIAKGLGWFPTRDEERGDAKGSEG